MALAARMMVEESTERLLTLYLGCKSVMKLLRGCKEVEVGGAAGVLSCFEIAFCTSPRNRSVRATSAVAMRVTGCLTRNVLMPSSALNVLARCLGFASVSRWLIVNLRSANIGMCFILSCWSRKVWCI